MKIIDYFELYRKLKPESKKSKIKIFSILSHKHTIVKYLKQNTKEIINNINYAFFESNEKYLLSVKCSENAKYIHINTRLTSNFNNSLFSSKDDYENFIAIFGTFAVLLDESFQIEDLKDSTLLQSIREKLDDFTHHIWFCDDFRLNLQDFIIDDVNLKVIYRYGYDFLASIFFALDQGKIDFERVRTLFSRDNLSSSHISDLYHSFLLIIAKMKVRGIDG